MMLNDETLMLFADGLLDAPERERVERLVTADPGLRARVDVFRVTGPDLARLFDAHLNAPVPAKLRDFVTAQARAPVEASRPKHAGAAALKARFAVQRPMPAWNITALAASVAVVAGIGLGWLLHGVASSDGTGGSDFVEIENQRLLAHGPLLGALETARSGSTTTVALGSGEEAQLRVRMTFQNEAREYCRSMVRCDACLATAGLFGGGADHSGGPQREWGHGRGDRHDDRRQPGGWRAGSRDHRQGLAKLIRTSA
jgi:anti-sigma factor RsiW